MYLVTVAELEAYDKFDVREHGWTVRVRDTITTDRITRYTVWQKMRESRKKKDV